VENSTRSEVMMKTDKYKSENEWKRLEGEVSRTMIVTKVVAGTETVTEKI
jgi:hypothetical protein